MGRIAQRVASFGTSIFSEMTTLANACGAINLGQGKPDFTPDESIIEHAVLALRSGQFHQYPPDAGTLTLRTAVADHARRFSGLTVDPRDGVVITDGASEALYAAIMGLVDAGDEVIVFEPCYDLYVPAIVMAGAIPVYVTLRPPAWAFDPDELRRAFTPRTRAVILNSPHNPTGTVFTEAEMTMIADLCVEHDVIAITDEVYEHLTYGTHHRSLATYAGMYERTVVISSASKTFSMTGWKVGWAYGHPDVVAGVYKAHQFITFAVHHPSQEAIAFALTQPDAFYDDLRQLYARKRDLLLGLLAQSGLQPQPPMGTFFIMADYRACFEGSPRAFAEYLTREIGVACIPPETFFHPNHANVADGYVRFSFCKHDEALVEAGKRLQRLR